MAQPATRRHARPTVYLMGFSCLPGDREYFEAQRATGSATPYWFKERVVYEELRAKPHTRTITAVEPKSDMADVRVRERKDKTAKEKSHKKLGTAQGEGKENSGIKATKNEEMERKASKEKDERTKAKESKKKDTNKNKVHKTKRNKSPSKRTRTIPLPGKRVRFAWSIAFKTKQRVPHTPRVQKLYKKSLKESTKPQMKKSNSSGIAAVNTPEAQDIETLYLLHRFPSPPHFHQPNISLSDAVSRHPHEPEQEEQGQEGTQTASAPLLPQSQPQTASQTPAQLQHGADTNDSSNDTPERDEPGARGAQEGEKNNLWGSCLGFCFGKRK